MITHDTENGKEQWRNTASPENVWAATTIKRKGQTTPGLAAVVRLLRGGQPFFTHYTTCEPFWQF